MIKRTAIMIAMLICMSMTIAYAQDATQTPSGDTPIETATPSATPTTPNPAEPPVTIKFLTHDGAQIGVFVGNRGDKFDAPSAGELEGHEFVGWENMTSLEIEMPTTFPSADTVYRASYAPLNVPSTMHSFEGSGTEEEPYVISTSHELIELSELTNGSHAADYNIKHYVLAANIDMQGIDFIPISSSTGSFGGMFDGKGHTISNLTVSGHANAGLFGFVKRLSGEYPHPVIENITLKNVYISGTNKTGALAGHMEGHARNIDVLNGNVSGSGGYVGGVVGYFGHYTAQTTFEMLGVTADSLDVTSVGSFSYAGGIAGTAFASVMDSHVTGTATVESDQYAGGLLGESFDVNGCSSTATVIGKDYVGGLVGRLVFYEEIAKEYAITNSFATGDVSGSASLVGGLVGYAGGRIDGCHATGDVTGDNIVGGLVGTGGYSADARVTGAITNSYATGNVSSNGIAGGLAGKTYHTVQNCYAAGNIEGGSHVGGLIGQMPESTERLLTPVVTFCVASGDVSSHGNSSYTGGLVGYANHGASRISFSYATGNVSGDTCVGGLVGEAKDVDISDSYALGSVIGSDNVGGFCGKVHADAKLKDNYAWGKAVIASGSENAGGFVGSTQSNIENNYTFIGTSVNGAFVKDRNFTTLDGTSVGDDMRSLENLNGAYTSEEWEESDGMPTLKNNSFDSVMTRPIHLRVHEVSIDGAVKVEGDFHASYEEKNGIIIYPAITSETVKVIANEDEEINKWEYSFVSAVTTQSPEGNEFAFTMYYDDEEVKIDYAHTYPTPTISAEPTPQVVEPTPSPAVDDNIPGTVLESVTVGDDTLSTKDYVIYKDGKFSLSFDYMASLADGNHTVRVKYKNALYESVVTTQNGIPLHTSPFEPLYSWSLFALISTVATVIASALYFFMDWGKTPNMKDEGNTQESTPSCVLLSTKGRMLPFLFATIISAASIVLLIVTQDFGGAMVVFDTYAIPFALLLILQNLLAYFLAKRGKGSSTA